MAATAPSDRRVGHRGPRRAFTIGETFAAERRGHRRKGRARQGTLPANAMRPPVSTGPLLAAPAVSATRDGLRRLLSRRWPRVLLAAQFVAAAVLLCRETAWLQRWELAVYDGLVVAWAGREPSDRILLVTTKETDIARYGWPLRDEQLH